MPSLISTIRVSLSLLMMAIAAFLGVIFVQTPAVPLIFLNRRLYFRWCSKAMGHYLLMVTCLLEDICGVKLVFSGDDRIKETKRSLIILNHRTIFDWMFIWMLHSRLNILAQLKIVLKSSLKYVPGPGWAMQHAGYVFLDRQWENDKKTIKDMSAFYKSCQSPVSILIFPEGTDFNEETRTKSNAYAAKQSKFSEPYDYCLHPRVTGFAYLLNTAKSDGVLDVVDDVTVGYEGTIPKSLTDLLKGSIPEAVHFDVKRYTINELPNTDEELAEWIQIRWDEKEKRLQKFYHEKQFNVQTNNMLNEQINSSVRFQRRLALLQWLLFMSFWSYCIYAFVKIKFFVILVCIFHLILDTFANGLIDFICQLDFNYRQNELKRTNVLIKKD